MIDDDRLARLEAQVRRQRVALVGATLVGTGAPLAAYAAPGLVTRPAGAPAAP